MVEAARICVSTATPLRIAWRSLAVAVVAAMPGGVPPLSSRVVMVVWVAAEWALLVPMYLAAPGLMEAKAGLLALGALAVVAADHFLQQSVMQRMEMAAIPSTSRVRLAEPGLAAAAAVVPPWVPVGVVLAWEPRRASKTGMAAVVAVAAEALQQRG